MRGFRGFCPMCGTGFFIPEHITRIGFACITCHGDIEIVVKLAGEINRVKTIAPDPTHERVEGWSSRDESAFRAIMKGIEL
jgi:hypothetical protein